MPSITGFIDRSMDKPVVLVRTASGKTFACTVDTGFNRSLLMGIKTARQLGVALTPNRTQITGAGNNKFFVRRGTLEILWTSGLYISNVLVHFRRTGKDEVLLGNQLLHPGTLTIEYLNDTVKIDP